MRILSSDRNVIRRLATEYALAASDVFHSHNANLWKTLNDIQPIRPMVLLDGLPWHEIRRNGELMDSCVDPTARKWETILRRTLYMWRHCRTDMVLNPYLLVDKHIGGSTFSIRLKPDSSHSIMDYLPVMQNENDVDRLVNLEMPRYAKEETEAEYDMLRSMCDGILPVHIAGVRHIHFTPWENVMQLWGIMNSMFEFIDHPDLFMYAMDRYMKQALTVLESFEDQRLLSPGAGNVRVGCGGYGYCSYLPETDSKAYCTTRQMWGSADVRMLYSLSHEAYEECALSSISAWNSRWGATCFSCAEVLPQETEISTYNPNVRKISFGTDVDFSQAVRSLGSGRVFSIRLKPHVFVSYDWDARRLEREIRDLIAPVVEARIPCELIMDDIPSVQNEPQRLSEWVAVMRAVCEDMSKYY